MKEEEIIQMRNKKLQSEKKIELENNHVEENQIKKNKIGFKKKIELEKKQEG